MGELDHLVCVECGNQRHDIPDVSPAEEMECGNCGSVEPAYMFDPHEILHD